MLNTCIVIITQAKKGSQAQLITAAYMASKMSACSLPETVICP